MNIYISLSIDTPERIADQILAAANPQVSAMDYQRLHQKITEGLTRFRQALERHQEDERWRKSRLEAQESPSG